MIFPFFHFLHFPSKVFSWHIQNWKVYLTEMLQLGLIHKGWNCRREYLTGLIVTVGKSERFISECHLKPCRVGQLRVFDFYIGFGQTEIEFSIFDNWPFSKAVCSHKGPSWPDFHFQAIFCPRLFLDSHMENTFGGIRDLWPKTL